MQTRILRAEKPVVFNASQENSIRYAKRHWEKQVFPIGNGRLGCTAFGAPAKERIQFNEDSLWVGNEHTTGGYQPFGDLYIELNHDDYSNYRRELDISRAVQTISYTSGGVQYQREYFSSYPAQVMVFRFTADRKNALSGKVWLDHMHRSEAARNQLKDPAAGQAIPTTAEGRTLMMKGETKDLFWWRLSLMQPRRIMAGREYASKKIINLDFEARARVLNEGGTVKTVGDAVVFDKCDTLTILLAADTNYINEREKEWRGEHPHARITAQLAAAEKRGFDDLLKEHVADYQRLYSRFAINLGDTPPNLKALPTAARVQEYGKQFKGEGRIADRDLEELMYQYARYLMISSSRPGYGGLPANLQGLWLYHIRPPWRCDYHTDINLQMNYWFANQANLSECFLPLAEWIDSIREVRKEETRKVLGIERGWLMRSENNVFGGSTYYFQKGDSAWLSQNLWDHYAFTQDKEYLQRYAYPVMKEVSQFWVDHLKELPDGTLVAPGGRSPEHGPAESDGVSYDQQLCWDLFSNTIDASAALGVDAEFRATLIKKRAKLLGPQIGRWGQLQEWMKDIDDPKNKHRHISHMIAVYPGHQVHPLKTPELAEAAKVSVIARGAGRTGWSKVHRACVFARLLAPARAYQRVGEILAAKTHGNLWASHPPFQIDANFGYAAAVNEMLVQSHLQVGNPPKTQIPKLQQGKPEITSPDPYLIHLLPALPDAWPDGSVKGMRLRGGYELDMSWKKRSLIRAVVRNVSGMDKTCVLRYGQKTRVFKLAEGDTRTLAEEDFQ